MFEFRTCQHFQTFQVQVNRKRFSEFSNVCFGLYCPACKISKGLLASICLRNMKRHTVQGSHGRVWRPSPKGLLVQSSCG